MSWERLLRCQPSVTASVIPDAPPAISGTLVDMVQTQPIESPQLGGLVTWNQILTQPSIPQFLQTFRVKGIRRFTPELRDNMGMPVATVTAPSIRVRKQRRYFGDSRVRKVGKYKTVGPIKLMVTLPLMLSDCQSSVIHALSNILPIEARINMFGLWHAVVLIGVCYRYANLTWILLSRANHEIYLSCHLLGDALHLFEALRPSMHLEESQRQTKWNRQGFNSVTCVYATRGDYVHHNAFRLKDLPGPVLQFSTSSHVLPTVQQFLGGSSLFLNRFSYKHRRHFPFDPLFGKLSEDTRGWKVFSSSTPIHGKCSAALHQLCRCDSYVQILRQRFVQYPHTLLDAGYAVAQMVPSSLRLRKGYNPSGDGQALYVHYLPFIQYVRNHPTEQFFPH